MTGPSGTEIHGNQGTEGGSPQQQKATETPAAMNLRNQAAALLREGGLRALQAIEQRGERRQFSTAHYEAIDVRTKKMLTELTARKLRERERGAWREQRNLSQIDFNDRRWASAKEYLDTVEDEAKAYYREKLTSLGIDESRVDKLRPTYVPASSIKDSGYVSANGQIVVGVKEEDFFYTGDTLAHEFGHGAAGIEEGYGNDRSIPYTISFGIDRRYWDSEAGEWLQQGNFLDNGLSVWDAADINERLRVKDRRLSSPAEDNQINFSFGGFGSVERTDIQMALAQGVPVELLRAKHNTPSEVAIIASMWRIARLFGDSEGAVGGRRKLDFARFTHNEAVFAEVDRIFGDDAELIKQVNQNPNEDEWEQIFAALDKAEERAGVKKPESAN